MSVTPLIAQADLEGRFTPARIVQCADDTNSGDPANAQVQANVTRACAEASGIAYAILGQGWSNDEILLLFTNGDEALKGATCDIAMDILGKRRQEFLNDDGKTLWWQARKDGEATLKLYATRQRKPTAVPVPVAVNHTIGTNTNRTRRELVFQADEDYKRGKGGF
jgi:hypothetical protein